MEFIENNSKKKNAIKRLAIWAAIFLLVDIVLVIYLFRSNDFLSILNLTISNIGILILAISILGGFWILCELYDVIKKPHKARTIKISDDSITVIFGYIYTVIYFSDITKFIFNKNGDPQTIVLKDGESINIPTVDKMSELKSLLRSKSAHAI